MAIPTERKESYGRERAVEMLMDMHKDGPAIRVAKIMVSSRKNTCCEVRVVSNGSYKNMILRLFPGRRFMFEEQRQWNLCLQHCVLYCFVLYCIVQITNNST